MAQHVLAQGKAKSNASFDCEDNLRVPADIIFGVIRGNCRDGCDERMFGEEQQPRTGPKRLTSGETRLGVAHGRAERTLCIYRVLSFDRGDGLIFEQTGV